MKTMRWVPMLFILGFALAFVGLTDTSSSAADKISIRVGSPFKAGHILVDAAEKFKELVTQGSGGRIEVQIDAGTKSEEDINTLNSSGALEAQLNGGRPLEVFAPQYFFLNAPYVMKDFDHLMRVFNGKLGEAAQAQGEQKGNVKIVGVVYRGLRQTTAKKPIYTPADVYGLKLRLPNVPTWVAVWKGLDAAPVTLTLPELYSGLKTGKAEASEGDLTQIASFKLDEVQTHLIMTNHMVQAGWVAINKSFFDKLSKADQDLVLLAVKDATAWANKKLMAGEVGLLVDLQRKGMQVVIPDAELFRVKAKPAVEELFQKEWPVTTWQEVLAQ
jgi:TRAP-type C4-dicarboxylate transport system substrate-binding protein